ncbi:MULTISPECIES: hypothetical protein [Halomicrobium]|uniref:Uncharacterized protein n=2 Tax=Halomicrobium mukohataei TaxID=57705 RepID=C7NWF5_HALMD|nr:MULTISPECIES: hypothetical protein [Halomicrobium]ACV46296.1 hypothetical protein Hmuk_0159 [Halomicrobium mukohataei DSM 12286]QCD64855.1 hypothetical protein E5139_04085 [Halomicrobium mukohataei]QFR19661.1 hypothetical protein GBQ70_04080 [Halomicrobium sp. ZPS1]
MAAVSKSETKVLDPHIPKGEQLIEAYSGNEKTVAVTDRRIIDLWHHEDDRSQETELRSTLLTNDYIVGTEYEREQESNTPDLERLIGFLLGVCGVGGILYGLDGTGGAIFGGFVLLALSALIIYLTDTTESGEVEITLYRAGEVPNRTWTFPKGETGVPRAISEQVATLHRP